ncbi:hypothetical protein ebA218 [Aromatoleum aromaticum EbN1]|uniref:Uncharacterized protein n=1 Tax=Aromatoleum aromaticum (strain DSM 19018 / LMG 30748 / EbN1) TaxID=76114 RepID=Q5P8W7_AROAE|nr:hypothetical protein [Aromatoleum aromaticum]CAI06242.1 hypothetical protein ebA218 [Aromatoleum aromaticum EbN1]
MTDYANFRSALNAIVKTLAPHHASDGRRAMAGKLAEAATGKTIDNLAFRYRDIGHLFFPHDEAAAIELGERISAARRAGEIASIIPFGDNGLLPTDLLTWANCPPVRASNPLSHWLPITEYDARGNDAPLTLKETVPALPAPEQEQAQEPSGTPRHEANDTREAKDYATTARICEAFPPPKSVNAERWASSEYLGDCPAWLKTARESNGKRGVSAMWNPAQFAFCMVSNGHIGKGAAAAIVRHEFPDWLDAWEEKGGFL